MDAAIQKRRLRGNMVSDDPRFAPDSSYAWLRLAMSLLLGTVACVGTWSVVVVLPSVQAEFGTLRAGAALPYTCC